MQMILRRTRRGPDATIGDLYVDGVFECHTLEDRVRVLGPHGEGKVYGETAIPAGTYPVIVTLSPKFGRLFPRLVDVPFFDGILIHKGNKSADTHGCILVARVIAGPDLVTHSTEAFDGLFGKLQAALAGGATASIAVVDAFSEVAHA